MLRHTTAVGGVRRLLALALLLLVAASLVLPASAATGGAGTDITERMATVSGLTPLEDALYRGMMNAEARIDLEGILPAPTTDDVRDAMQHLANAAPELFHVDTGYTTMTSGGVAVAVTPTYTLTGQALLSARLDYLARLAEITAGVDPAWSDAEICLYLHDYLCRNFAYDTTYSVYDAYGFLTGGTGVCQSYTLTYTALLAQFDIPVTYATGKDGTVAHIWNIVTLDGVPYHVDVTWGDPLSGGADDFGVATHTNFLKSDAAIDATGHTDRVNRGGVVCNDTRYDEAPFTPVLSSAAFLHGTAYVVDDGQVLALGDDLLTSTEVYTLTEQWQSGLSYLVHRPACVTAYGGLLYINAPKKLLSLDPASGLTDDVLSVSGAELIMALIGDENVLTYEVAEDISGRGTAYLTHTLAEVIPPCTGEHEMREYISIPPTCAAEGSTESRCDICGHRETVAIPALPHDERTEVVPPTYGEVGYTEAVCAVCGHTERRDEVPALPMPTVAEYAAAVRAVSEATDPATYFAAVQEAKEIEPHLDPDAIAADRAALAEAIAAYDARAAAVNSDLGGVMTSVLAMDAGLLSSAATAFAVLLLALRRVLFV